METHESNNIVFAIGIWRLTSLATSMVGLSIGHLVNEKNVDKNMCLYMKCTK